MDTLPFHLKRKTTSFLFFFTAKPIDSVGRSLDRLKKRIIGNSQEASFHYAKRNAKLNEERCQILASQADKRDRKVDLKRQYRKGDFPDIQIKRSDLIRPLQALAKVCSIFQNHVTNAIKI